MASRQHFEMKHLKSPNRIMAPFFWMGGKGLLASRIVPHLPPAQVYVEPYCGAASVFWHLPRPYPVEVLNDIHQGIVNLFRCLQDPAMFEVLAHRIRWTPYARAEFVRAMEARNSSDPVEAAWGFYTTQNQGFAGRNAKQAGDWGRVFISEAGMANTSSKLRRRMALLERWHDRLTRVQIDCRPALEVIQYWDSPGTLFYLDPPYVIDSRVGGTAYSHELSDDDHRGLIDALLNLKGMAVLSGYHSPIYAPLTEAGWKVLEIQTACHAAGRTRASNLRGTGAALKHAARTEVLWLNPAAVKAQRGERLL